MGGRDDDAGRAPGLPAGRSGDPDAGVAGGGYAGAAEDAAWVQAARAGDEQAFGRLFDRWFDPVYDVAWRIVWNRDTAAEVAQDVFLVVWQSLDGLERPGSFGGWVRRIARNRALNRLDSERRSIPDDDQAAAALDRSAPAVDLTAALGERDQRALVWAAARALGERDASLLDLHLRHGFGAGEIADELGVTTNNAHQLLHRLKGKLRGAIEAWVLWRGSGRGCPELDRAVAAAGVVTFGADAVRVIGRHTRGCTDCAERQQLRLAPEALFAAMPVMLAPPLLKAEAAAALGHAGVPMSGSTASASAPGGADAGGADADAGGADAGGADAGGADACGADGGGANGGSAQASGQDAGTADACGADEDGAESGGAEAGEAQAGPGGGGSADLSVSPAVGPHDGGDTTAASRTHLADPSPADGPGPERSRRRVLVAGLVALVAVVGLAVAVVAGDGPDRAETARRAPESTPVPTTVRPATTSSAPTVAPDAVVPAPTVTASTERAAGGDGTADPAPPASTGATDVTDPAPAPPPPVEPIPAPTISGFRATLPGTWCGPTPSAGTVHVTLVWQSVDADSATLAGPDGTTSEPPSGSATRCAASGQMFTLTVTGPGGTATRQASVPTA